jgi:hypothetical protein
MHNSCISLVVQNWLLIVFSRDLTAWGSILLLLLVECVITEGRLRENRLELICDLRHLM